MYKTLTLPLLITLFFHGCIIAVLLIDAPESRPIVKRAATQYINATLVVMDKPKAKPKAKPRAKPKPKSKPAQDKAKQLAQQKQREAALAKQQSRKLAQEKEKQRKQELEKRLEQEREKQERLRQESERELTDAIAQEEAENRLMGDAELANSYIALITGVIQNNWNRPPSARNNMEAELALQLVPTGEVVSVTVIRSSGNSAFDRSAKAAVLKAERFPELQQLPGRVFEQYFRRLHLRFKPEDLRL